MGGKETYKFAPTEEFIEIIKASDERGQARAEDVSQDSVQLGEVHMKKVGNRKTEKTMMFGVKHNEMEIDQQNEQEYTALGDLIS